MNGEKIKTDAVVAVADKIKCCNNEMKDGLTELHQNHKQLGKQLGGRSGKRCVKQIPCVGKRALPGTIYGIKQL